MTSPSRNISDLLSIMERLRDRETGCPWDVEQTFRSIAPYTVEEAYEVADAIERDDMVDLCDELGDLLLQVVFHSRIAEELGAFSFGDVVEAVTRKMIRRHPHVFGPDRVAGAGLAKGQWEAIKDEEKREKRARKLALANTRDHAETSAVSWLDDVPRSLPPMLEAEKLQHRAARVGFDWPEAQQVLDKIEEEIAELRAELEAETVEDDRIASEWGDLAFALVNLARHLAVSPETALRGCNSKFRQRFSMIESELSRSGSDLETATLEEMEALWQKSKEKAV